MFEFERISDLDDKGVSPAVGIILLIAITGFLAGILGYFVFSQEPGEPVPIVDLSPEAKDGSIRFFHQGGDKIWNAPRTISVKFNGEDVDNLGFTGGITIWRSGTGLSQIPRTRRTTH